MLARAGRKCAGAFFRGIEQAVTQRGIDVEERFANMRRCTECILPETFPGIEFDEGGVCNYCLDYEPVRVYGEDELSKLLDGYRGKGEKYDCIVPISGGRDGSFTLHQMVRKYEMRVLALTVDSGAITLEGYRNSAHGCSENG